MRWWLGITALMTVAPAQAADLREFCADRPGLDTPACTIDVGHVQIETGILDWTREKDPDSRTDTMLAGDMVARVGVGRSTEMGLGWTAYGRERERDRTTGDVAIAHRVGDVTLGLKQNLRNPDGSGLSLALLPSVTLPIGRRPIGDGTWSAGLLVPASWEVTENVHLQLTPEVDAAANESGDGRHLAIGSTAGIDFALTDTLDLDLEVEAFRVRDPEQHATLALAGASLAYQAGENMQFDVGGVAGLNRNSPNLRLYCGIVRRF